MQISGDMSAAFATRTGLLKGLRFHIGPRTLRSQGVSVDNVQPIFNCKKLPWWSRWTYFLVVADLVFTYVSQLIHLIYLSH